MCCNNDRIALKSFIEDGKAKRRKTFIGWKVLTLIDHGHYKKLESPIFDFFWRRGVNIAKMRNGKEISKNYIYSEDSNRTSGIHVYLNKGDAERQIIPLNGMCRVVVPVVCRYEDLLAIDSTGFGCKEAVLTKVVLTRKEYKKALIAG